MAQEADGEESCAPLLLHFDWTIEEELTYYQRLKIVDAK